MSRRGSRALLLFLALAGSSLACNELTGVDDLDYTLGLGGAGGGAQTSSGSSSAPPFWEYRSVNLSQSEIDRYNDPMTGAAQQGVNKQFQFDLDAPNNWFNLDDGQTPSITTEGLLRSVRQTGDPSVRSVIAAWAKGAGATTNPDSRSFSLERRYRYGFDVYLPSSVADWGGVIDGANVLQHAQKADGATESTGRPGPFALGIENQGGTPHWFVAVQGDDAPDVAGPDPKYSVATHPSAKATAPISSDGFERWYHFEVEVVWSYQDAAETRVWLDDVPLYDNAAAKEPAFKNCFNDIDNGVNIGPILPSFGLSTYDDPPTVMELSYDNMWIADLGP